MSRHKAVFGQKKILGGFYHSMNIDPDYKYISSIPARGPHGTVSLEGILEASSHTVYSRMIKAVNGLCANYECRNEALHLLLSGTLRDSAI